MARVVVFYTMLLLACGYALRRGGAPERWAAAILLGGTAATWALVISPRGYFGAFYRGVQLGMLAVDAAMLVALLTVALLADRFWPLWLTALHAFSVVGHLAKAIAPDILPNVYLTTQAFAAYPGLLLLMLATRWHALRMGETGRDPSWSRSSLASIRRWRVSVPTG